MDENLNVTKEYKEAFNLGYEMAKELNLKSPMFRDLNSGSDRMQAMQAGMAEYSTEIAQEKKEEIDKFLDLNGDKRTHLDKDAKQNKGKDKGFGL